MMNFTTQAAQDIMSKIERDPAEARHWRQLLILAFDQKAVDEMQTLQIIVGAIEQIWNKKRQSAKDAHEAAKAKQRATGSRDPLPSLAVLNIPLTLRQKETLIRLAKQPQSATVLFRFGLHLEEEFDLPTPSRAVYERAMALLTDDDTVESKIVEGLQRLNARLRDEAPGATPPEPKNTEGKLEPVASPESMGVKSPSHHRPSAAALIKRTGRLSVDRGRIQVGQTTVNDMSWPETQKKLDETMGKLLALAARVCETAPRPMRLPRSIAPSQWLEFLEGHVTLLLATLEAQDIIVRTTINLEDSPRHDVAARTHLVTAMMGEIESALAELPPREKTASGKATIVAKPPVDELFNWIDAGALSEAEAHLRSMERGALPDEQASEIWTHLALAFQNNHENTRAMVAYEQARELNPSNLQAWFNGGMIQHEEGMLLPARESYRKALELDPDQPKIWCNLGALEFQLGEFEPSVDALNHAVRLKPDYARAWDNLAGSLCALDQLDEAERCCHRALNFKPGYADPNFKLGSIYFQRDRMADAEKVFREVLEANPGYPLAGHYLAMVLARSGQLGPALEACENAATPPGEIEVPSLAWNEMAYHLYEAGEYEEAIRAYEKALTFTPERAVIWLDAGVAHHQLGELDQARRHYEQAVELDPDLVRAWNNHATVKHELGDERGSQEDLAEAERLLAMGR
jgi:tetratricopeptide (TPR) repeat protein